MVKVNSISPFSTTVTDAISENARFVNVKLEHFQGEILALCKDQHGCRYLQKKLEERNPEHVQLIFVETHHYVVELMTGTDSPPNIVSAPTDEHRSIWQLSLPEAARIFK